MTQLSRRRGAFRRRSEARCEATRVSSVIILRELRMIKDPQHSVSPLRPEPEGFAARVTRTACSLCKGWCCTNGADHAYLDQVTISRVRRATLPLDVRAVLRLYVDRIPE